MSKQYKIKRSRKYSNAGSYRAGPHPVAVVLGVVVLCALVFVGVSIYQPVYDAIMGNRPAGQTTEPTEPVTEPLVTEPTTEPAPEPSTRVEGLRTVYLPHATAADPAALDAFLDALSGTEINAVLVDIKNAAGNVLFQSRNEQAAEWGTVAADAIDLAQLNGALAQRGLMLAVRLSAFRDPLAASAGRENAILYQNTEWLWLDNAQEAGGKPWLSPYADGSRDYVLSLALEAADAGARMVVLENVQFPPNSVANATFGPNTGDVTRPQILRAFLEDITLALDSRGVRTALYLTAISLTQEYDNSVRYGGSPLDIIPDSLDVAVGALPYQFGGDYNTAGLVVEQPVQNPGAATDAILRYVAALYEQAGREAPALIPLLQGGNEPGVGGASPYTRAEVDAQIAAAAAAGYGEYLLYNTSGDYLFQE